MIIHSKFKDYYDVGLAYGVDTTLHWNREYRRVKKEHNRLREAFRVHGKRYAIYFCYFEIIVCGVKYSGVYCNNNGKTEYFYDFNDLDKYIRKLGVSYYKYFCEPGYSWDNQSLRDTVKSTYYFSRNNQYIDICEKYDTCIITYEQDGMYINSSLKDYCFYKVMDSVTCFNEVVMFMTNHILVKEKELVQIEDKYKIGMHGFDKWSFRKQGNKQK